MTIELGNWNDTLTRILMITAPEEVRQCLPSETLHDDGMAWFQVAPGTQLLKVNPANGQAQLYQEGRLVSQGPFDQILTDAKEAGPEGPAGDSEGIGGEKPPKGL